MNNSNRTGYADGSKKRNLYATFASKIFIIMNRKTTTLRADTLQSSIY